MLDEHKEHLRPARSAAAVQHACRAKNVVAGLNTSSVALNLSRDDVQVFVTIGVTVRFIAPTCLEPPERYLNVIPTLEVLPGPAGEAA